MTWRLRQRSTFAQLRRDGVRASRGPVSVRFEPDPLGRPPRIGYAITRRVGGAVVRNRLRRRLRAAVAEVAAAGEPLAPGAYLVGARPPAVELSTEHLKEHVDKVLRIANERAADRMVTS